MTVCSRLLNFIAVPAHSRDFGWCDFVYPFIIESPVEEWVWERQSRKGTFCACAIATKMNVNVRR